MVLLDKHKPKIAFGNRSFLFLFHFQLFKNLNFELADMLSVHKNNYFKVID